MFRKSHRYLAATVAAAGLLFTACSSDPSSADAANEEELTPITVMVPPSVFATPLYLGQEEGIFEEHGFDVTIEAGTSMAEMMPLLMNDEAQYIFGDIHNTILAQDEGMPIAIGAPNGINADTEPDKGFANILVADDSGIEELADLENRQIATNSINGQAQLDNTTYMENKGVDVSTIEWVGVPLEQAVAGLRQGQYDAITIAEPSGTIAMQEGGVKMLGSADAAIPEAPMFALVSLDTYLEEDSEQAERFQDAVIEANTMANNDRDAVEAVLPNIMDLPEEAIDEVVLPPFAEAPFDPASSEPVVERLVDTGILPSDADVDLESLFPLS